jgi:GNAT superfamily N-acetyltransferase
VPIEILPVLPTDAPELARICYQAFGGLHDRHGVPRDFPDDSGPQFLFSMMTARQDFLGVAAHLDGRLVGSNFLQISDDVAAVGPITVDPSVQARGIGRALMGAVLDLARERGIAQVRLMQEAVNTTSLSLYSDLGFAWRDAIAILQLAPPAPGAADDTSIRPLTTDDLRAVEALSTQHYHHSRRREVAAAIDWHLPGFVREKGGRVVAYLLPGYFGHGFAPAAEDMLALMAHAAAAAPPPFQRVLCPLSQSEFYRASLGAGCRTVKVMNYMSVGPYTPPRHVWIPSIGC